jgi:hypothetical protein
VNEHATRTIRRRLRFEAGVALLAAALAVLTLISREWIEVLTGWDPDGGDGSLEWLLVTGLATVAAGSALLALADRRRLAAT